MKRSRQELEVFSLSFLDVITCAFGAMILILLVTRHDDVLPGIIEDAEQQLELLSSEEKVKDDLRVQLENLNQKLENKLKENNQLLQLQAAAKEKLGVSHKKSAQASRENDGLNLVNETLKRASISNRPIKEKDVEVGGIPVNSDYIIFIIDTSGSMKIIWADVMRTIENVLSIHPKVSGFQIMSDNGEYLIGGYAGHWITDTPVLRSTAIKLLRNWRAFSNSSPVEGLEKAIKVYGKRKENISIYIFGDDYTGGSFDNVISLLERINTNFTDGKPLIKIHGIGFIHSGTYIPSLVPERKFSILMREVVRRNGGAFVALPIK